MPHDNKKAFLSGSRGARVKARLRLLSIVAVVCWLGSQVVSQATEQYSAIRFGYVEMSVPAGGPSDDEPKGLAVLLDDGGAALRSAYTAALHEQGFAVAALTPAHYARLLQPWYGNCASPAEVMGDVADALASRYGLPASRPVIVALGAGGACSAELAAGGGGRVHALISVDRCGAVTSACPRLCGERRGQNTVPWFAFEHARPGAGCADSAAAAIDDIKATVVSSPQDTVPGEFSVLVQWLDPGIRKQGVSGNAVAGVPLIAERAGDARRVVIFLSGDGGWAELDRGVTDALRARAISTIGWDSLSYLWQPRTPAALAIDLAAVIDAYATAWGSTEFVLAAYSLGANVLPFAVNRLTESARRRVVTVVLLAPGKRTAFEFHLSDWAGADTVAPYEVGPEIERITVPPTVICVKGSDDDESVCPPLSAPSEIVTKAGDHHFEDDYRGLAAIIERAFVAQSAPERPTTGR